MKKIIPKRRLSFIFIILLFSIFGGLISGTISRVYVFDKIYPLPFFGEINFSNKDYKGSGIIIRDAKKVVVEQETKITETIKSTKNSVVGIFKKNNLELINLKNGTSELSDTKDLSYRLNKNNFYNLRKESGQGLIITADGWIVSNIKFTNNKKANIVGNYVIITKNNELYEIDNAVIDPLTKFYFLHAKGAHDFPVIGFSDNKNISSGELVIYNNFHQDVVSTSIIGIKESDELVRSSDSYFDEIKTVNSLKDKNTGFLFNLKEEVVGLIESDGDVRPISHFFTAIESLLNNQKIDRPKLGINYINLSDLFIPQEDQKINNYLDKAVIYRNKNGISVEKNSLAFKAGLKENDIIVSINNIEINKNNNLTYLVQKYLPSETILIEYLREGKLYSVNIDL